MERTLYHFYIETGEIHGRLGEPSLSMGLCEGREIYVKCQDVTPVCSLSKRLIATLSSQRETGVSVEWR